MKITLITGAASGLGKSFAKLYACNTSGAQASMLASTQLKSIPFDVSVIVLDTRQP